MYIYLNGEIIKREEARISAFDHGFVYGLGLFETFPVINGHPFLLDDHFQRLHKGLEQLGIKWSYTRTDAVKVINELLEINNLSNAYVRWNVSAGEEDIGLYTGPYLEPTTIVYIKPLPPTPKEKRGRFLSIPRNTPEGDVRLKSHHYLNNILAKRELGNEANVEGIFLTNSGYIAEGIVSNIFWVKEEKVYTPSIDTGILNGITRQYVLALLEKWNISYEEGHYQPDDLLKSDECFITNSIQEVVPLFFNEAREQKELSPLLTRLRESFKQNRTLLWSKDELWEDQ